MGCLESRPVAPPAALSVGQKPKKAGSEAKIVLLGDSGVGKSSLALRFCQGRFPNYHEVTVGAAFFQQMVRTKDNTNMKLHLWDTGGQERFRAMAPLYYRDAAGAIVVYDCSDANSFESVKFWIQELKSKGPRDVFITFAANKSDLDPSQKAVSRSEALEFCSRLNDGTEFCEVSAMTGDNVGVMFEQLAARIYEHQRTISGDLD